MSMSSKYISSEYFKKRMIDLCLRSGLTNFPEKYQDKMIFLKSIANLFFPNRVYSEAQVNDIIKSWLDMLTQFANWDFMMLRRRLVDEGFLDRNPDGSCYWLSLKDLAGFEFDPAIAQLKIDQILVEGWQLITQKKIAYLYSSQG